VGVSVALGVLAVSSITAVLSLFVTMWVAPLTAAMTTFEAVKLSGVWVCRNGPESFSLFVGVKNVGEATATIQNLLLNGVPFKESRGATQVVVVSNGGERPLNPDDSQTYLTLAPGARGQILVELPEGMFTLAQTVTLEIETLSGVGYLATVLLL